MLQEQLLYNTQPNGVTERLRNVFTAGTFPCYGVKVTAGNTNISMLTTNDQFPAPICPYPNRVDKLLTGFTLLWAAVGAPKSLSGAHLNARSSSFRLPQPLTSHYLTLFQTRSLASHFKLSLCLIKLYPAKVHRCQLQRRQSVIHPYYF